MSLVLPFAMASRPLQAVPDPGTEGLQVLTGDKGKLYVDLSRLQGEDGAGFSAGNAGLTDLKGVHTLVPVGSPLIREITVNSQLVKTFGAVGANGISIGATGGSLFNEDFEVFLNFQIEDGIPPSTQSLLGVTSNSPFSFFNVLLASSGKLLIRYRTTTEDSRWDSTSAIMSDGVNGPHLLRIKYDFTTNTFGAWLDKTPIPGSFISGSIAGLNPANFTPDIDFVIGNNSTDGTLASNPVINSITGFAVTHLLTDQEADDVSDHMVDFGEVIPIGDAPTVQATNLRYSGRQTSIILNWDGGNGTNKIVIGKAAGAVTGAPTNGINYTANSIFGSGSEIGTDNFVVHNGVSNTVTVTGLTRDTIYHFDVYEFNANGFQYLTTIDSNTIQARTAYIYDEDFADYATDYTENQVEGFTSDVVAGELVLVGNPKGYQDWVQHNEWETDLENFEIEILLRINDDLTSDTAGIGIGIKNDVDNEVNRGVVGEFITAVGSSAFGKLQIYSGNGTSSPSAYTWRSESSTSFAPSNGSMYKMLFRRQVVGDDANYSIILTDVLDPEQPFMSTAWTETGRPSSNFMATTTRAWIYQNGGNHAIDYFSVKRIDGASPEEPIDADVYVSVSGNDSFDGLTPEQPKRTVAGGLNAIAALGGSVGSKVLSIGPGTYTETQLTPPNNLKLAYGASRELTIINAHNSTFSLTNRSAMSGALLNVTSGSSTNIDMEWRSLTLDGMGGGVLNNPNSCKLGVSVNKKHGLKLSDIEIRHFNTCALRIGEVDDFEIDNFLLFESASVWPNNLATYYHLETWNVGGGTALGNADGNFKIIIKNGTIRDQRYGGGSGWGMVGGAGGAEGNDKYQTNIEFANITFDQNPDSPDNEGHHFNIEGIYFAVGNIAIHDCIFNSNLSWGGLHGLATNLGKTRIYNNTFRLDNTGVSYVIEMQISNVEIDHNFVTGVVGARNGCFVILNTMSTFGNAGHAPVTRVPHGDWHIHHNIIECQAQSYSDGIMGALRWKVEGIVIEHNTIRFKTTSGQPWVGVIISNISGNTMTGLVHQNNLYIGQPSSGSNMFAPSNGLVTGGISRYNFSSHIPFNAKSGITQSNNQGGLGLSALGLIGGTPPANIDQAFNGNYYRLSSSSNLKNAGYQGATPGALEAL